MANDILELMEAQTRARPIQPIGGPLLVFVSSMVGELREEREALEGALRQASPFMPWVFEHTTATSLPLPEAYLRRVRECDLFVLLISANVSPPVVAEYETALDARNPILAFVRRGEQSKESVDFVQRGEQAGAFKYAFFDGADDLAGLVVEAVLQELIDRNRDYWRAVKEGLIPPPDAEQVIRAYAAEIITHRLFADWQERYTPLRAIVELPRRYQTQERQPDRPEGKRRVREYTDLRDALRDYKGIILVGEPGAGKTTSLQRMALDYAAAIQLETQGLLPVYLPLGGYTPARSLSTYLIDQLKAAALETAGGSQPAHAHRWLAGHLEALRRSGRFLFLLDGLNELRQADRGQALDEVRRFIQAALASGCQVVVTCRADDYAEISGLAGLTEVLVQELDNEGIEFFLRAHLDDRANDLMRKLREDRRGLLELARNPYRLWMIQAVYAEYGELPTNRALLFQRMVDWLLKRQKEVCERVEPEAWFDAEVIQAVLARLAYAMLADPAIFTVAPLNWVDGYMDGRVLVRGRRELYEPRRVLALARSARLTVETESLPEHPEEAGTLRFTHQLLQEYLAAVHLNTLGTDHPKVLDCLRYDAWDETVLLLAGLTPRLDWLVEHLIPLTPFLAARCTGVAPERLSQPVAVQLVETLAYLAEDFYSPWRKEAIAALSASHLQAALLPLLRLTQDQPSDIRKSATAALGELGDREAIPELVEMMWGEEAEVGWAAIRSIGKLWAHEVIPELVDMLQNEDQAMRHVAVLTLGFIEAREIIPALVERLQDEDWGVRFASASALGRMKAREAIPALVERMRDEKAEVREAAVKSLGTLKAGDCIPVMVELLHDEDKDVRRAAATALGMVETQEAIPTLLERLHDEDEDVRPDVRGALVELWTRDEIPALVGRLQDKDSEVRMSVAWALGSMKACEAIPALVERLQDEDPRVRFASAIALGIFMKAREAVPALVERLQDEDSGVRKAAVQALGNIEAWEAIPTLVEQVRGDDLNVRRVAISALGLLAGEGILALAERLNDEDECIRRAAIEALGKLWVREEIHTLIELLQIKEEDLGAIILESLRMCGVFPDLIQSAQSKMFQVRRAFATALGNVWTKDDISNLMELLQDGDRNMRRAAAMALGGLEAQEAIPNLVERLLDKELLVRRDAAEALEKLRAQEAVPVLVLLLVEGSYEIRDALVAMPSQAVLSVLRPFLSYPYEEIWQYVIPLYDEVRKKAWQPREPSYANARLRGPEEPLPLRATLKALVALADQALALIPNWPSAVGYKASALLLLNCAAAAMEILETVDAEKWECAVTNLARIYCLRNLNQHYEAIQLVRQVLTKASDDSIILTQCACLLAEMGLAEEAEALYGRAIALKEEVGSYRERAAFYIRQARYDEADADIAHVIEMDPWHPDTLGQWGQLALARGQFTEALAAFQEAAHRDPHSAQWRYGIAFAHLGMDRGEQAQAALKEALARTELHEQVEAALQDLALLERAQPSLPGLEIVRERILERKALLDRLAKEECPRYGTGEQ